jgi:type VI secretion system protein ImpK
MCSDKTDKTVFRQSQGTSKDSTIIKPAPGGRSAGYTPQAPAGTSASHAAYAQQRTGNTRVPYVEPQGGQFNTAAGLNPLVNAAAMLVAVFSKVHGSMSHPNVGGLHQQIVKEIRTFETRVKEQNIKPEIVLSARYILCAVLDEAVLNTPWGAESAWTQRTLLSVFHNETHGGEKFFQILDRMRDRPAENLDILELMYLCLSLGFMGKYRVVHHGREKIEQMRDELFKIIRTHRGEYERTLSPSGQGLGKVRNSLAHYVPMWVIASVMAGILVLGFSTFRVMMYNSSADIVKQLADVAKSDVTTQSNNPNLGK